MKAPIQNYNQYGFCGLFQVLETESQEEYDSLLNGFRQEFQPSTPTENILVDGLVRHYRLGQRARTLQTACFTAADSPTAKPKRTSPSCWDTRTVHDRAFSDRLKELTR